MKSRTLRTCALSLAFALLLGACDGGGGEDPGADRSPVASPTLESGRVIALVGTMSGSASFMGTDAFEGADLGIAHLNRTLDDGELPFELVTLDDQGDPATATELIQRVATEERTVGVIHAGDPAALPPAVGLLAEEGIPGVLVHGDLYSARLLRSHLFQVSPPYLWQARRIASYLGKDRDYDVVSIVAERSLSGDAAVDSMKSAVASTAGLRLIVRRYTDPDRIADALDRLKKARVEAVVFQGTPRSFDRTVDELAAMNAFYRGTRAARWASLPANQRRNRNKTQWRPHLVGFAEAIWPSGSRPPSGTVASDTYARGAHHLPVPSFKEFDRAFEGWWAEPPHGHELRAYQAVRMIGWAARRAAPEEDIAVVLEGLEGERFGGLDVTLGPDDHVVVEQTTVGLWVVPGRNEEVRGGEPPELQWVPLARGFSTDGTRTDVLPQDWRYLFRNPPPRSAPAPKVTAMRFGIATPKRDPLH